MNFITVKTFYLTEYRVAKTYVDIIPFPDCCEVLFMHDLAGKCDAASKVHKQG